eukprot:GEMP01067472.1.p1 GENE.GEMP01067472.1~~GEMP01067472.1.p1  ORF type:complete len:240 (+),score=19.24 GEMP01067472.1:52-771(+)
MSSHANSNLAMRLRQYRNHLHGCLFAVTGSQIVYDLYLFMYGFSWLNFICNLTLLANALVILCDILAVYVFWRPSNIPALMPLLTIVIGLLTVVLIFKAVVWGEFHLIGLYRSGQFVVLLAGAVSSAAACLTGWRVYVFLRCSRRIDAWLTCYPTPPIKEVSPLELCLTPNEIQNVHDNTECCRASSTAPYMDFHAPTQYQNVGDHMLPPYDETITEMHHVASARSTLPLLASGSASSL